MFGRNEPRETARPEAKRRIIIRRCVGCVFVLVLLATISCFVVTGIASYIVAGGDYLPSGFGWVLGCGFLGIVPSFILGMVWGHFRETELERIERNYHL